MAATMEAEYRLPAGWPNALSLTAQPSLLARTRLQRPWHDRKVPQPAWIGITRCHCYSINFFGHVG